MVMVTGLWETARDTRMRQSNLYRRLVKHLWRALSRQATLILMRETRFHTLLIRLYWMTYIPTERPTVQARQKGMNVEVTCWSDYRNYLEEWREGKIT